MSKTFVQILSAKGGVGKTTTTINSARCYKELTEEPPGIFDIDLTTPNVLEELPEPEREAEIDEEKETLKPALVEGIEIVSHGMNLPIGMAMRRDAEFRVGVIRDYIEGTDWDSDVIFIDSPPGNVDEVYKILDFLEGKKSMALVVSTGAKTSLIDAERSIDLIADTSTLPAGIVLNMTKYKTEDDEYPLFDDEIPDRIRGVPVVTEVPFEREGPNLSYYEDIIERISEVEEKLEKAKQEVRE